MNPLEGLLRMPLRSILLDLCGVSSRHRESVFYSDTPFAIKRGGDLKAGLVPRTPCIYQAVFRRVTLGGQAPS
jgi:hypothetical protein